MLRTLAAVVALSAAVSARAVDPCERACLTDFDDGTGTGTPDGGVTFDDLIYYLHLFVDGAPCADLTDGFGEGPDGGVTIDDLLLFIWYFTEGSC